MAKDSEAALSLGGMGIMCLTLTGTGVGCGGGFPQVSPASCNLQDPEKLSVAGALVHDSTNPHQRNHT